MKKAKRFMAVLAAVALVLALAPAAKAEATVKGTSGWGSTTVADFGTVDFDKLVSYTFTLKFDTPVDDSTNFQFVIQNTVDWAWTQATVGVSTAVQDWQGINYAYAWEKVDDTTVKFTVANEGAYKLQTTGDKLAIGDWNAYDITDVTVKFNYADSTPKTGDSAIFVFFGLVMLCGAAFVAVKATRKAY